MSNNVLRKEESDYVGHMFLPGFGKMLKTKSWFPDACKVGQECPQCPPWLVDYLTPEGFDHLKIRTMLKDPAQHGKVCLLVHKFQDHLGMTMEHATDAEWGKKPNEECDFETSAKMIGIVAEGKIVDQVLLPRNPAPFVAAVNRVVGASLYDELERNFAPFSA